MEVFYICLHTLIKIWLEEEITISGKIFNIRTKLENGSLFTLDILKINNKLMLMLNGLIVRIQIYMKKSIIISLHNYMYF